MDRSSDLLYRWCLPLCLWLGCDVQATRDAGPTAVLAAVSAAPSRAEAKAARREARRADSKAAPKSKAARKPKVGPKVGPKADSPTAPTTIAPPPGLPACPPDNPLTYRSFGAGFLLTWCTGCHSSRLTAKDRQDAPDDLDLDSAASYRANAPLVYDRAVLEGRKLEADPAGASPMPPAGLVPPDELRRLEQWIACGSPGA
jgi:hypothetical protein